VQGIVKQFFNEKEVTSTLVMDALYCGCRQLERLGRKKVGSGRSAIAPQCAEPFLMCSTSRDVARC
jgi:hypothetical protein